MVSKLQMYRIVVIALLFTLISCKKSLSTLREEEEERVKSIQEFYKQKIKTNYIINNSYPNREEAIKAFLNEIIENKNTVSLCDEVESKEILFPNCYNTNTMIANEFPDRAWDFIRERQKLGLKSMQAKLENKKIKEIKVNWDKQIRDLNSLKGHVPREFIVKTDKQDVAIKEIKLVIEHNNQYKVCIVSL